MRWSTKNKLTINDLHATRVITKFLILPENIDGEWRWLEKVKIKQNVVRTHHHYHWEDEEWID